MGKRIIIVGLPLFAKRLEKDLCEYDARLKVTALDTYYKRKDRIKAMLLIPFCSVLYSINGTTSKSKVFDWAFFWKKRVMMTWVGTDVTKAINNPNRLQKYLDKASHYCEVKWIQQELRLELGIDAEILNFFNFDINQSSAFIKNASNLVVLSYIGAGREKYYGLDKIIELAKCFPNVEFRIAGIENHSEEPYENIKFLGWVRDMKLEFDKCHVTARLIEHDGLSGFVLESMLYGKYVLYSQPLRNTLFSPDLLESKKHLEVLVSRFVQFNLHENNQAKEWVKENFNKQYILDRLIKILNN